MKTSKKKILLSRKVNKGSDITTTSVAFRTPILLGLKSHDLVVNKDRSVSWIVNRLSEKFLAGTISLD